MEIIVLIGLLLAVIINTGIFVFLEHAIEIAMSNPENVYLATTGMIIAIIVGVVSVIGFVLLSFGSYIKENMKGSRKINICLMGLGIGMSLFCYCTGIQNAYDITTNRMACLFGLTGLFLFAIFVWYIGFIQLLKWVSEIGG